MCVALPPNQPMSISGQGVGKFEQSSLFMHLPGDHDDFSDDVIGNDFDDWVSSWITWRWRNSITL